MKRTKLAVYIIVTTCICISGCSTKQDDKDKVSQEKPDSSIEEELIPNKEEDMISEDNNIVNESNNTHDSSEEQLEEDKVNTTQVYPDNQTEEEKVEEDLMDKINEKYYSWQHEDLMKALDERTGYFQQSGYHSEITNYWEGFRGVTDIGGLIEPLFYTEMKYYTKEDFKDEPLLIIHIAKNEIYAKRGYIFKNEDLQNYFMGCVWYNPVSSAEEFDDSVFNEYEVANLKILAELDTYK